VIIITQMHLRSNIFWVGFVEVSVLTLA